MSRNVLVLTSTFPRWVDDVEPRFVESLCGELAKHHSVTVLAPHASGAQRYEKLRIGGLDIDVHRYRYFIPSMQSLAYDGGILSKLRGNALNLFQVPFFLLAQLFKLASLNRKRNFDVIHAHWIIPQGLVAAVYSALWRNAPAFVVTAHGGDLFALRGRLLTAAKRWILRRAGRITVVSNAMKSHCIELGVDARAIDVQSMGVDLIATFTPGSCSAQRNDLIFVGRLVEKKGVPTLIRAMVSLAKKHPHLALTIVGDGPDRKQLQHLVRELRLDERISFVGSKLNADLPALFRATEIAVMPSVVADSGDQEGLGLVAIEAMGCGCAVVATDLPAISDSVRHGETGLIAEAGNDADLAQQIDRLLSDPSLLQSIAENGRQFAIQNFDWRIVGRRYAEILSEFQPNRGSGSKFIK